MQSPLQLVKFEPDAGVADSVTELPLVKLAEQVAPQFIPVGEDETVPDPVPDLVAVRTKLAVGVAEEELLALLAP